VIDWKPYTGIENLTAIAVDAGISSEAYVGRGDIYGNLLPGRIDFVNPTSYCLQFGAEPCMDEFEYLDNHNDQYTFEWMPSKNGETLFNAVTVQSFFIGRIVKDGVLSLGVVVPGYGMTYYDYAVNNWQYSNNSYQVLTCLPYVKPVVYYDCRELVFWTLKTFKFKISKPFNFLLDF
jgi:hypothetical protein